MNKQAPLPHQERILAEKKELDLKIIGLGTFLSDPDQTEKVDGQEIDRMQRQLDCMNAYSGILTERIDAWTENSVDQDND